jgi:hypothetical protein
MDAEIFRLFIQAGKLGEYDVPIVSAFGGLASHSRFYGPSTEGMFMELLLWLLLLNAILPFMFLAILLLSGWKLALKIGRKEGDFWGSYCTPMHRSLYHSKSRRRLRIWPIAYILVSPFCCWYVVQYDHSFTGVFRGRWLQDLASAGSTETMLFLMLFGLVGGISSVFGVFAAWRTMLEK